MGEGRLVKNRDAVRRVLIVEAGPTLSLVALPRFCVRGQSLIIDAKTDDTRSEVDADDVSSYCRMSPPSTFRRGSC